MRLTKLPVFDPETGHVNVVVETPKGSRNKYRYDEKLKMFQLHSLLPVGAVFPFDFGFIPSTCGEDGDPLDVLLLMEEPAPGAFLVPARLIGVIEAVQSDGDEKLRNDRLIAVSAASHTHEKVESLSDLGPQRIEEIEQFFISYNHMHGKLFKPVGCHGAARALKLVKKGEARFSGDANGHASGKKKRGAEH
jgi:inorganic pyrophosphatase